MISAVVVTWRGDGLVAACVDSLLKQRLAPQEILVVHSNEPRDLGLPVPVLQLGSNLGFARAANAGVLAVKGHPLLLNDDTVLDPDCLAALESARQENPEAVLQPRLLLPDGRVDNQGHGFFPDGFVWARGRGGPDQAIPGQPSGFSGAAVLFPRQLWLDLGGFDPRFDSFGEDVDLSLRLLRRGVPVRAVPEARVLHHLGASYGRSSPDKIFRIERNRVRAAVRSLPASALALLPALTLGRYALLGGLAVLGRGPGATVDREGQKAALRGVWAGMTDSGDWWEERRRDRATWQRGERQMWAALWEGRVRAEDLWRGDA